MDIVHWTSSVDTSCGNYIIIPYFCTRQLDVTLSPLLFFQTKLYQQNNIFVLPDNQSQFNQMLVKPSGNVTDIMPQT